MSSNQDTKPKQIISVPKPNQTMTRTNAFQPRKNKLKQIKLVPKANQIGCLNLAKQGMSTSVYLFLFSLVKP